MEGSNSLQILSSTLKLLATKQSLKKILNKSSAVNMLLPLT
jgi:hypothetical protein